MGMYTIKSGKLSLRIRSLGAELISLRDCTTGQEYLWNGDPEYWKRTSPVLFPLVGNYKNKEVRHNGHIYNMSQHGFARDMEFELISLKQNEAWFGLSSSVETIRKFPFPFGHRLIKSRPFCADAGTLRGVFNVTSGINLPGFY